MEKNKLGAIIISAGYSSRMGDFKPLLKFGECTAVEMIINTFKASKIDDIVVIVGHRQNEVIDVIKNLGVKWIKNEDYSKGMFSSIVKGMEVLQEDVKGFFMNPVDIPLIKTHTVNMLKDKYMESGKGIIYPKFNGKSGHPPFIDCKYRSEIMKSDGEGGLKRILQKFDNDSIRISVPDQGILMDMDIKEDYKKLLEYFYLGAPNLEECYCILDLYGVPCNIRRHSDKVSEIALNILNKLNSKEYNFNKDIMLAAGLLHDLARKEKNHAKEGAKILSDLGYPNVGKIIATHMDIEVNEEDNITEGELLYLADKVVQEDELVGLEKRFSEYSLKFSNNPEALNKVRKRFGEARKIEKKIKSVLGKDFSYE